MEALKQKAFVYGQIALEHFLTYKDKAIDLANNLDDRQILIISIIAAVLLIYMTYRMFGTMVAIFVLFLLIIIYVLYNSNINSSVEMFNQGKANRMQKYEEEIMKDDEGLRPGTSTMEKSASSVNSIIK